MNITVDLKISANEELANALLTLAALMHNTNPNYTNLSKPSLELKEKNITKDESKEEPEQKTKFVTIEMLRGKLAELSKAGKQEEVKALINKFGGKKLTEVPKENYKALLEEAEKIS